LKLNIRQLGLQDYVATWHAMQVFTKQRNEQTRDEIWLLEHPPVYTLGRNAKPEHLLNTRNVPVVAIDRGGQVTYHGPGQLVMYVLLDIRRLNIGVRKLVTLLETSVVDLLGDYGIYAEADEKAPGVYVTGRKIAALGLRVSRGCTYHGLSLNLDMNLDPFNGINPCGYAGLEIIQCRDLGISDKKEQLASKLVTYLANYLGYYPDQLQWMTTHHPE
jgi:lipoyl(octanoyl) transferase